MTDSSDTAYWDHDGPRRYPVEAEESPFLDGIVVAFGLVLLATPFVGYWLIRRRLRRR